MGEPLGTISLLLLHCVVDLTKIKPCKDDNQQV